MKSKATLYLLIVAVLSIWGFVAWRIIGAVPSRSVPIVATRRIEANDSAANEYSLSLDYSDPFMVSTKITKKTKRKMVVRPIETAVPKPPKERVKIRYVGHIDCGSQHDYLIEFNGQLCIMSVGESADDFVLQSVSADSLTLTKNGNDYTIAISQ